MDSKQGSGLFALLIKLVVDVDVVNWDLECWRDTLQKAFLLIVFYLLPREEILASDCRAYTRAFYFVSKVWDIIILVFFVSFIFAIHGHLP